MCAALCFDGRVLSYAPERRRHWPSAHCARCSPIAVAAQCQEMTAALRCLAPPLNPENRDGNGGRGGGIWMDTEGETGIL